MRGNPHRGIAILPEHQSLLVGRGRLELLDQFHQHGFGYRSSRQRPIVFLPSCSNQLDRNIHMDNQSGNSETSGDAAIVVAKEPKAIRVVDDDGLPHRERIPHKLERQLMGSRPLFHGNPKSSVKSAPRVDFIEAHEACASG